MQKKMTSILITLIALFVILYPVFVWYESAGDMPLQPGALFPVFGLIAFATMYLHVTGAALQPWLERYINFEKFVHRTSYLVLLSIVLHPLLLFIAFGFGNLPAMLASIYIQLAIGGWLLLLTYDIGKIFKRHEFFIRHWEKIKIISTIGFFLIFFHSLGLGSHLQSGSLRTLWILYGLSAGIAATYTYIVRRLYN